MLLARSVPHASSGSPMPLVFNEGGVEVVSSNIFLDDPLREKKIQPLGLQDITGHVFGKLTALEYVGAGGKDAPSNSRGSNWLCACDCGNQIVVSRIRLKNKERRSCGCLRESLARPKSPPKTDPLDPYYFDSMKSAGKRDLEWTLTREQFRDLVIQDCTYCKSAPIERPAPGGRPGQFNRAKLNGIDRVDNSQGYIPGNMVPCCKQCNLAKSRYPVAELLAWIERVRKC